MKALAALALSAALAGSAAAQPANNEYLDLYVAKVKPEKRADFDAIARKLADANRKNDGDKWLTFEGAYGENDTVYFVSTRADMASIDTAMESFMKAMKAAYGTGSETIFHELENCLISSRSELRRRRWDLSSMPGGEDAYNKYLGEAKWIRTTAMRVRPGHIADYEEVAAMLKDAAEKADPTAVRLVSQVIAGDAAGTYYLSTMQPNLGGFDGATPTAKELLGDEGYEKYRRVVAESVIGSETMIGKFLPELSNPPEEVVNITRDFWAPKPAMEMAARAKQSGKKNEKPK